MGAPKLAPPCESSSALRLKAASAILIHRFRTGDTTTMNDHVRLLEEYLDELCRRMERRESLPRWKRWRERALRAAGPLALGLTVAACEAEVEELECSGSTCRAQCTDEQDNDDDGLTDCQDPDCESIAACTSVNLYGLPIEQCGDGVDNDRDGLVDCDDSYCAAEPHCGGSAVYSAPLEVCNDGIDNDGDQSVDCDDPDCATDVNCGTVPVYSIAMERCENGTDDDGDNLVDCDDPDCDQQAICGNVPTEASCSDGVDNDGDNLIDCDDPDCYCGVPIYNVFVELK